MVGRWGVIAGARTEPHHFFPSRQYFWQTVKATAYTRPISFGAVARFALADVQWCGFNVPAGTFVLALWDHLTEPATAPVVFVRRSAGKRWFASH